jgi:hypothetical protein
MGDEPWRGSLFSAANGCRMAALESAQGDRSLNANSKLRADAI